MEIRTGEVSGLEVKSFYERDGEGSRDWFKTHRSTFDLDGQKVQFVSKSQPCLTEGHPVVVVGLLKAEVLECYAYQNLKTRRSQTKPFLSLLFWALVLSGFASAATYGLFTEELSVPWYETLGTFAMLLALLAGGVYFFYEMGQVIKARMLLNDQRGRVQPPVHLALPGQIVVAESPAETSSSAVADRDSSDPQEKSRLDQEKLQRLIVPGFTVSREGEAFLFKLNGTWGRDKPYLQIPILGFVIFLAVSCWLGYMHELSALEIGLLVCGWVAWLVLAYLIAWVEHFISFDRNELKIWTQNKLGLFRSEQSIPTESIRDFDLHHTTVLLTKTRGVVVVQERGPVKLCHNSLTDKCNGMLAEQLRDALHDLVDEA